MSDIKFNQGFSGCTERMAILKNQVVPRDLSKFSELPEANESAKLSDAIVYVRKDGKDYSYNLNNLLNDLLTTVSNYDSAKQQVLQHTAGDSGSFVWVTIEEQEA